MNSLRFKLRREEFRKMLTNSHVDDIVADIVCYFTDILRRARFFAQQFISVKHDVCFFSVTLRHCKCVQVIQRASKFLPSVRPHAQVQPSPKAGALFIDTEYIVTGVGCLVVT